MLRKNKPWGNVHGTAFNEKADHVTVECNVRFYILAYKHVLRDLEENTLKCYHVLYE